MCILVCVCMCVHARAYMYVLYMHACMDAPLLDHCSTSMRQAINWWGITGILYTYIMYHAYHTLAYDVTPSGLKLPTLNPLAIGYILACVCMCIHTSWGVTYCICMYAWMHLCLIIV